MEPHAKKRTPARSRAVESHPRVPARSVAPRPRARVRERGRAPTEPPTDPRESENGYPTDERLFYLSRYGGG